MSMRGYSRGAFAIVLMAVLIFSAVAPGSFALSKFTGQPTVSAAGKTIDHSGLSSPVQSRLSGLVNNEVSVTFVATGNEVALRCDGSRLRYTIDGSNPSDSSQAIFTATSGGTSGSSCGSPATASNSYTFVLVDGNFTGAAPNALVTFRFEINTVGSGVQNDDNGGIYYKYRIDRSRAVFTAKSPANVTQSSLGDVSVTNLNKPAISFTLADNDAEAPLNQSTFAILVDEVDRTNAFDCTLVTFSATCTLDYADMPATFTFSEGQHTIRPTGADTANNAFDPVKGVMTLRVDKTAPEVKNITATPNQQGGTSGGLPIVSRGANVTVKANVEDLNVNKNSTTAARAVLFNETNPSVPLSPAFAMLFNTTSGKFEGNATVPLTWPEEAMGIRVRVLGQDQAGNVRMNNTTADAFILDPVLPVIQEQSPPGPFIRDTATRITARITDVGSGLDTNQVKITYSNLTGSFKSIPSSSTNVNNAPNVFEARMNRIGATDNFTYDLPAANPGTTVTYQITAKDKAGGPAATVLRTLTVDIDGPTVNEIEPKEFRSKTPFVFEFSITDSGAGANTTANRLFFTTGTTYQFAPLVRDATSGNYVATISPVVSDGQELKYYAEAKDLLGNIGRDGNTTTPKISRIDLVPPTVATVTAPATASGSTFLVEWDATDSLSGVANYTVEARVNDGTPSIWIPILNGTTEKSIQFCGEGGHKYEFRVAATDVAGNTATMPANPQASTELSGAGCEEQVLVSIISPSVGQVIDGASGTFPVRFSASSTRTFTPSSELRVDILFSPDGTFWHTVETGVQNTGTYSLDLGDLPNCSACKIRVVAKTLTGASDEDTSGAFTLRNADADADLDGNGLPDSWEVLYLGRVGLAEPDADNDGDGLTNLEESRLGTDPDNRDTDGDGASDRAESRAGTDPLDASDVPTLVQARTDEYTNWYWTVPGLFLATTILFFVGLARRW